MAERHVLLIDSDETFHAELQHLLAPYGVAVEWVNDGSDGLSRVADVGPELILIAVDLPDKLGYALCNKAKKGVAKYLPVMLATATIPPGDLEQHRKLKVHADDYVDKRTIAHDALVAKIDGLMGLGPPMDAEPPVEDVVVDDLAIESEEIAFEDEPGEFNAEATSVGAGLVDPGIDAETDAVFESLIDPSLDEENTSPPLPNAPRLTASSVPLPGVAPLPTPAWQSPMTPGLVTSAPSRAVTPAPAPAPIRAATPTPAPPPPRKNATLPPITQPAVPIAVALEPAELPPESTVDHILDHEHDLDLGLEAVVDSPSAPHTTAAATGMGGDNGLEAEIQRLRVQLDEARRATAPAPTQSAFSREREFLNLREIINRKEKEQLDLKDELDGKDRLIMGGKEKIRELERKVRDADERLLHFEGELVNSREAQAALKDDKEKAVERERGLKARIEMAQGQLRKADEDFEALKKKSLSDTQTIRDELAARRGELDRERAAAATQITALEAKLVSNARAAEEAQRTALASLGHLLEAERDAKVASARAELAETTKRLTAEHQAEVSQLRDDAQREQKRVQAEHTELLGRTVKEHQAAVAKLTSDHAGALSLSDDRRKRELVDNDEMWRAEAKAAERRREKELTARDDEHKRLLGEASAAHAARLELREAEHNGALRAAQQQAKSESAAQADKHKAELGAAEARRARELMAAAAEHAAALAAAVDAHTATLDATVESHRAAVESTQAGHAEAVATLAKTHADEKAGLTQSHRQQVTALESDAAKLSASVAASEARANKLETSLDAAQGTLKQREERVAHLERDLAEREARLAAHEARLNALNTEHERLSREHGEVEEQLLKAYQRLRADEAAVTKAKKALAVALTTLDGEGVGGGAPG